MKRSIAFQEVFARLILMKDSPLMYTDLKENISNYGDALTVNDKIILELKAIDFINRKNIIKICQ